MARLTCSTPANCSPETVAISWTSSDVLRIAGTISSSKLPARSETVMLSLASVPISCAATWLRSASLRTSAATTAKPLPCSPARAYKHNATVFFSDIANFTTRCETYTPAEVAAQVNTLFEIMTRIIMEHEGDIDKFLGDGCMAFWLDKNPLVSAERAIRVVLRLRRAIDIMNRENPVLAADPIHIRMGLNTGEVILCDLGAADARIDLTMIGDTVNTAARFESASKQYGVDNLVSEFTLVPLLDRFEARLLDRVKVKGKNHPVACYELFDEKGQLSPQEYQL